MQPSRLVAVIAGLLATLLAVPALAAPGQASDRAERDPGNPVAHCLPDREPDEDDGTEEDATEDDGTEEDATEDDGTEEDATEDDGAEDDGSTGGSVAECVLASLPDIVGSPHAASVVAIVERGIANGKADGTYGTQDDVTRGQMATFLARALDLQASDQSTLPDDVHPDYVHADAIAAVIEEAIALGKEDGSFAPQDPVTRGQMAAFLTRALDLVEEAGGELPEDVRGSVHERAIEAITDNAIANGFPDGTFRPGETVTRGQMASFLDRALNL